MSKIIVTAVGVSGSGKSNAYGAIIQQFSKQRSSHGYYLTACGATREERMRNWGIIDRYANISDGFVAQGTMIGTDFPFAFGGHFRPDIPPYPLLDLPLYDYPGGLLPTMMNDGSPESDRLLHRIANTDVLLLFADANILSEGTVDAQYNPMPARKKIALEINTIFRVLGTEKNQSFVSRPRTVILLLTKCDSNLIPKQLREKNFLGLVNRALQVFDSVIGFCENQPGWKIAIVPTSTCGDGNSRTWRNENGAYQSEMTASPQPYGFDIGLLYGIMCELENRIEFGTDDDAFLPDSIEHQAGFVSKLQWWYIRKYLSGRESEEQMELYQRYATNLHSILDPIKRTQFYEF